MQDKITYKIKIAYKMKQITLILLCFITFLSATAQEDLSQLPRKTIAGKEFYIYSVAASEGLYSVSRKFKISQDEIVENNPSAKGGLRAGQKLFIPATPAATVGMQQSNTSAHQDSVTQPTYIEHTVKAKETLYSISHLYDISIDQILKLNPQVSKENLYQGVVLRISKDPNAVAALANVVAAATQAAPVHSEPTEVLPDHQRHQIALFLPLQLNATPPPSRRDLYVEFYEGFLLAIDSLQRNGANLDIQLLDTQDSDLVVDSLTKIPAFKDFDLIFAPANDTHIAQISVAAAMHKIPVVNIFSIKNEEQIKAPNLFQINISNHLMFTAAINEFIKENRDKEIIFLQDKGTASDKKEFIQQLKSELNTKGIVYKDETILTGDTLSLIPNSVMLSRGVVFVPYSANYTLTAKVVTALRHYKTTYPSLTLSLFGYPEYQTYFKDLLEGFYQLNTQFYTRFFINDLEEKTAKFRRDFSLWYNKELQPSMPSYAILGYDAALNFLPAVDKYGKKFPVKLSQFPAESIQTDYHFTHVNNERGLMNVRFYFVTLTPQYTIHKRLIDAR